LILKIEVRLAVAFLVEIVSKLGGMAGIELFLERVEAGKKLQ
jgi:hypothetical protein